MKYVVTECHDGYAVLMDEGAGFVHAANLHYAVGQTVTDPILMQEAEPAEKRITVRRILPVLAAAACLAVVSAAGFSYYSGKYKTHSVVVMSSDANIKMYLNKQGEVLSVQAEDDYAEEILKDYDTKNKSKTDVANDLLAKQIESGHLTSGDTVDFYISADTNAAYDTYKTEFETEIQQVRVSVQELGVPEPPKPDKAEKPAAPVTPAAPDPKADPKNDPKAEPAKPDPAKDQPKLPDAPKETPAQAVKPAENPRKNVTPVQPANPPAPPVKPNTPPTAGKEQTPPVLPTKPEEKPELLPDEPKKPEEIEKTDTEEKPDDSIPAPEKPEEQEGGKPVLPDPDTEQTGDKDKEEKKPAEVHPPLPRPEPANGLLPKQDPLQITDPPELFAVLV